MSDEFLGSSGVSESGAGSGSTADTSSAASPAAEAPATQTEISAGEPASLPRESAAETEGAVPAAAVPEPDPIEGIQPDQIADELARKAFIQQRLEIKDAKDYRAAVDPLFAGAAQQWGVDWSQATPEQREAIVRSVEADHQMVNSLYADTPDARMKFFTDLSAQSPEAYKRIEADLASNMRMQALCLAELGCKPEELDEVVSWIQSGAWRDQKAATPEKAEESVNQQTLDDIADPRRQQIYKDLPAHKRQIADKLFDNALDAYLDEQEGLLASERDAAEKAKRDAEARAESQRQAVEQSKVRAYESVRGLVQQSLAKLFPNNEAALNLVLSAAEQRLYGTPEGAALWRELEGYLERGEVRAFQNKLPLMIAKARVIADEVAKPVNEMEDKARQFDELMRLGSPEQVMAFIAQARGKQTPIQPGHQPPSNGHTSLADPGRAGQYDPANVVSYFPRN